MGNISNSNKKFLQDWIQVQKQGSPGTFTNVWIQKKGSKKIQMIEYPLHVSSQEDIQEERKIFWLRLNHHQLVSSLYFLDETKSEFCASNYQGNVFIERIPLTLQTVTDIPFPDALHVYDQALVGFHILASEIVNSCFPISQQHIGINCEAVCKVWMNSKYEKNFPSRNQRIHQHIMVKMILNTIQENVDVGSLPQGVPSPMNYIYSMSRSPTQVRFDQAIALFQNYTKEFFKGQVPTKLECVDKVGGIYNLSKNWKNRYDTLQTAVRNHDSEFVMGGSAVQQQQPQLQTNSTSNLNAVSNQFTETNNYTAFRRQQPMAQTFTRQDNNQSQIIRGTTPSFSKAGQTNIFTGSKVQLPIIYQQPQQQQVQQLPSQVKFQQSRVIQQVVYQNPASVPPEIVRTFSQQKISGSVVRGPTVQNGVVTTQRSQVKESFIQNRVINSQFNNGVPQQLPVLVQQVSNQQQRPFEQLYQPQQPQFVQNPPQQTFVQQLPPLIINQQLPPQQIIKQQNPFIIQQQQQNPVNYQRNLQQFNTPQPVYNQRFPPNVGFMKIGVNPQSQSQVNNVPPSQIINQQPINFVRGSEVSFGNRVVNQPPQFVNQPPQQFLPPQQPQFIPLQQQSPQPQQFIQFIPPQFQQPQQVSSTPYQVSKTSSVYATPIGVTKVQTQRIQSKNTIIQTQYQQSNINTDQILNLRLRNNEQSISSINPQTTNQVQSNQQISDKFSMMKQQPIDTSTRNFYNNMMNNNQDISSRQQPQQNNDYFSSYYANYTSKLYDNTEVVAGEVQSSPLNKFGINNKQEDRESNQVANKFKVTLDDGMSSPDFLTQLKNIKTTASPSPFLKTEANYDYGLTNKYSSGDSNSEEFYKFDYKNYTSKLTDGVNPQKDLNIVTEKLNITPASNIVSSQQKDQYNINYEHQSGQNETGDLKYESQQVQVSRNDGSYAEEYNETVNYQSTFDKYAAIDKYQSQIPISLQKKGFQLGENLQTQFSRSNNIDTQQATKNTVNNTSYSPMHQKSEEQYQVEYDPQILADLQRLKGVY